MKLIPNKTNLLYFSGPHCSQCKSVTAFIDGLSNPKINVIKKDVSTPDGIKSASKYSVMSVPSLFLFEGNKLTKTYTGNVNITELAALLPS
jgi:thiol-disulfide isomerase/thioredoxin